MESTNMKKLGGKQLGLIAVVVVLVVAILVVAGTSLTAKESKLEVDLSATLEKIVETSDLSTAEFLYQGIVEIPNPKKTTETDYYICYDAQVYAGIDFSKIEFVEDKTNKKITAKIPDVEINDIVVVPSSLDFIFNNKKADNIDITQVALTACEEDVYREVTEGSALLEIARENAVNVIKALTEPIVEQVYSDYTFVVENAVEE